MGIVLTFALNAVLNLVVGLVVAGVLGPAEYGRFAIASMAAIVLFTALFDWVRLSATRFTHGDAKEAGLDASLDAAYLAMVALVLVGAAGIAVAGPSLGLPPGLVLVVAVAAAATGLIEIGAARTRALFLNGAYIRLILAKNVLAFVLMVAAAWLTHSALWVLAMFALANGLASLASGRRLRPVPSALSKATRNHLATFARYGFPIVVANLVYQGIVLLNRGVVADRFGFAEAGQLSLATDLTIRLFLSVGAALDAYLFQVAVRRQAEEGEAEGRRQIALNMLIVLAVLSFLGASYAAAMPALEAIFVPQQFRGSFGPLALAMLPGVLAFCFGQFAVGPVFQLTHRTSALLWTTLVALAVDGVLLWFVPAEAGLLAIAAIHSLSLAAGLLAALVTASSLRGCWPTLGQVGTVLLAALLALGAMWPMRSLGSPWLALIAAGLVGPVVFAGTLWLLDLGGLRQALASQVRRLRRASASPT
ncbi:lipopolysaccharide biosynthesis protein [Enterovirga rhinocerotis]|uniref:O-antigen/teichoic acid export membrane protein n=1 Tax=Enterovirga rhinocerotis TaxID=1339210 RepID=A0A4R7C8T3_9HYPH|nr:lipopolysaccharide biosynthesis protein [Enterovirga rhinocerotis]TDR93266.1 O-antigen/teichoic acid export membrane protein [Enterovirga rhinocerotis]